MNCLLAANPVGPLPKGLLSLSRHLARPVTTYLTSKVGVEFTFRLKQPTTLGKLMTGLLVGVCSLQWISLDQPVWGLLIQIGVIFLFFEIELRSNLKSLLKVSSQAPTMGLQSSLSWDYSLVNSHCQFRF